LITGTAAVTATALVLWVAGALKDMSQSTGQSIWLILFAYLIVMVFAGALYGRVFMRAANDYRGGWLFGIGYGFLLWMIGPVTLMQWAWAHPLVVGRSAQALFASHLAYGLVLGALFPHVHRAVKRNARRLAVPTD
jgi:hypothetical protein